MRAFCLILALTQPALAAPDAEAELDDFLMPDFEDLEEAVTEAAATEAAATEAAATEAAVTEAAAPIVEIATPEYEPPVLRPGWTARFALAGDFGHLTKDDVYGREVDMTRLGFEVAGGYRWPYVGVDLEVGYSHGQNSGAENTAHERLFEPVDLDYLGFSLFVTGRGFIPIVKRITLVPQLGLGYMGLYDRDKDAFGLETRELHFALKLGLGVDYQITGHFFLQTAFNYSFTGSDLDAYFHNFSPRLGIGWLF